MRTKPFAGVALLTTALACGSGAPPQSAPPPAQAPHAAAPPAARVEVQSPVPEQWRLAAQGVTPAAGWHAPVKGLVPPREAIVETTTSRYVARVGPDTPGLESTSNRLTLRAYESRISSPVREVAIDGELVNPFGLAWAPDGSALGLCEGNRVSLVDWTGRREALYTGPGGLYPGACADLRWSSDGSTITFVQLEHASDPSLANPAHVTLTLERQPPTSSPPRKDPTP